VIRGADDATVIGVSAAVVYDIISATNSSPQTTEINAPHRAESLMKWVKLGLVQAGVFIGIMTLAEPAGKKWRPLSGGGLAAVLLWFQYVYARNAGLAKVAGGAAVTETFGPQVATVRRRR
jgi:hypothetical protein